MSKILELREKRAKAWEAAKAFLDAKRTQEGFVSAEDAAIYDKMEADVVNLGKEIERLERQAAIDVELSKATSTPITNQPNAEKSGEIKKGRATDEYKQAFWNSMRNKILYRMSTRKNWYRHWKMRVSSVILLQLSRLPAVTVRFLSLHQKARQHGLMRADSSRNPMTVLDRHLSVHISWQP